MQQCIGNLFLVFCGLVALQMGCLLRLGPQQSSIQQVGCVELSCLLLHASRNKIFGCLFLGLVLLRGRGP